MSEPRTRTRPPPPFWALVEGSLEEAEFLWKLWDDGLDACDRTLPDLATWVEDRLLGAIDGLCVGGADAVERLLAPALAEEALPRAAAAGHALLAGGTPAGAGLFTRAFLSATGERLGALRRAIELAAGPALDDLAKGAGQAGPEALAAIIDAHAFQQRCPPGDLVDLAGSSSRHLQRALARACRFAPGWDRLLGRALAFPDPSARALAVESGLVLGDPPAWTACRQLAPLKAPGSGRLLLLVALRGTARDHDLVLGALGLAARRREALRAAAFAGTRAAADACVDLLTQGIETKLAAEAFCAITGLELVAAGMVVPPADEPDDADEDLDRSLVPTPDDLLPEPEVAAVAAWWNEHRPRFDPDRQYVAGRVADLPGLCDALERGPTRRRHALALKLAIATGGRYQVQTRAFSREQRRQMSRVSTVT